MKEKSDRKHLSFKMRIGRSIHLKSNIWKNLKRGKWEDTEGKNLPILMAKLL